MIPKVSYGSRTQGLLAYLFGPGRSDEHTNPRIVAGYDEPSVLQPPRLPDGRFLVGELSALLDAPHEALGARGLAEHVWHCSLSLPPDETAQGDERWQQIASRFVAEMGFAGDGEQAGCRWVAVHHGASKGGNDHVHVVVIRATEDGRPVWLRWDKKRSQQVADLLEDEFGLVKRCQRDAATGRPESSRVQIEIAAQRGLPAPERDLLRTRVRAALAAAGSEAEWVARMRADGLLVAARTDKRKNPSFVHGYAVALPAVPGDRPRWFSGRELDGELSIVRVRQRWPGQDPLSLSGWTAAKRAGAQQDKDVPAAATDRMQQWRSTAAALDEVRGRLAALDPGSPEWPAAARQVADVLTRTAVMAEPSAAGPLNSAASMLTRAAAPRPGQTVEISPLIGIGARRVCATLAALGSVRSQPEARLALAVVTAATRLVIRVAEVFAAQQSASQAGAALRSVTHIETMLLQAAATGIKVPSPQQQPVPRPAEPQRRQRPGSRETGRDNDRGR